MRIVLWGAGGTLNREIDHINREIHSIEYLIDSDIEKCGNSKWGIPIKHYKDAEIQDIDSIVITTRFYKEVLETIKTEFPEIEIPVFIDTDHFLAYEYVHITHKEIAENPLYQILDKNHFQYETDKRLQYLETYDRYFSKYRGSAVTFMEIGVYQGDSLKLWKDYFGDKSTIIGIDIDAECKKYQEDQIKIEIGPQESSFFWEYIKQKYPHVDIVLDDGGHAMNQQISTFTELFPHLQQNGIYMCEDVFTSYWPQFEGAWKKQSTFVEHAKDLVDHMNTKFAPMSKFAPTYPYWNTHSVDYIKSVCFHQGIIVMEKDSVCKKLDNTLLRNQNMLK